MRALKKTIPHIFLMAYLLVILYPFLFVLFSSVKSDNQAIAANPFGPPGSIIFDNYVNAWVNAKISTYFSTVCILAYCRPVCPSCWRRCWRSR